MLVACLLVLLSVISCSTRSGLVRRCSPQTISNSSTISLSSTIEYEEDNNNSFKTLCLSLSQDIKRFAMNQLGLVGSHSCINFSDYNIENWPVFVPFHCKNWDEQAVKDLRTALPTLIFKPKIFIGTRPKASDNSMEFRIMNCRKLLDKMIELFNEQTGLKVRRVPWSQYHLRGWPVGVSVRADRWTSPEVLAIYRHLDRIKFVQIIGNRIRNVTFTDGTTANVDDLNQSIAVKNRRKRKAHHSDDESEQESTHENQNISENRDNSSNSEVNQHSQDENALEEEYHNTNTTNELEDDDEDDLDIIVEEDELIQGANSSDSSPTLRAASAETDTLSDFDNFMIESLKDYNPDLDSFYDAEISNSFSKLA